MLFRSSVIILPIILFLSSALIALGQANYTFEYPLTCSTHQINLSEGQVSSSEAYPGKPYSGKVMYFLFEAIDEEITIYTESISDIVDTELFVYEGQFPDISPLAYADNNGEYLGQGEVQLNNLILGEFYTLAISGKNGSEGEIMLHIEGDCYSISGIRDLQDASSELKCGISSSLSPGLFKGDDNSPTEGRLDTLHFPYGGTYVSYIPGTHPAGHLSINEVGILAEERSICVPFLVTEDSIRLQITGSESVQSYSINYHIVKNDWPNGYVSFSSGSSGASTSPDIDISFEIDPNDQNSLKANRISYLVLEIVGVENPSEITLEALYNVNNSCAGNGSIADPQFIIPGYTEVNQFYIGQTVSYAVEEYLNPLFCINPEIDGNSPFPTKVFRFIGDGTEFSFFLQGGLQAEFDIYTAIPGTGNYFDPPEYEISTTSGFLPISILVQEVGDDSCVLQIDSNENDNDIGTGTFQSVDGQEYLLYLSWNDRTYPSSSYDDVIPYLFQFFKASQAAAQFMLNSYRPVLCGSSTLLEHPTSSEQSLETPCGSFTSQATETFSFEGTGEFISMQSIFRGAASDSSLFHSINCFKLLPDTTLECVYSEEGFSSEVLDFSFSSELNSIYLVNIGRSQPILDSLSHSFELFSLDCSECLTAFGSQEYPAPISDPFMQRTFEDIAHCCNLSWNGTCEDHFNQLILDTIASNSSSISCGVHELKSTVNPILSDYLLGDGQFDPNFTWNCYRFSGTDETITVQVTAPVSSGKLDPKIMVFTGNGIGTYSVEASEQDQALDGSSEVNFESELNKDYFILISGFNNSYGDFTLTITDPNQCGLCPVEFSGDFPGGSDDPIFNSLIQINSSCCDEWSNSCQSLYEVSYFPGCSTIPQVSCGDTLVGSTVGQAIYTGHNCNGEAFSSGSRWYSFIGDGSTYTIESLQLTTGISFNTRLHIFTGECPFLNCIASDEVGGAASNGLVSIPTDSGKQYFIAITGVGMEEGDFSVSLINSDYCGFDCFSAYANQHNYNGEDPIYQSVIQSQASCCESWGYECELAYQLNACAGSYEPNNSLEQASFQGVLSSNASDKLIQASISGTFDEDHYSLSLLQAGTLNINLNSNALLPDLQLSVYRNGEQIATSEFAASLEFIDLEISEAEIGDIIIKVWPAENTDFSMNECYELSWYWNPQPCSISVSSIVGECSPSSNTFEVDLELQAENYFGFNWIINGSEFQISGSNGVFTLTDQHSDGISKNLYIFLKEDPSCSLFITDAYIAPEPCSIASCPMDGNGDGLINTADLTNLLGSFGSTCP